MCDKLPCSPRIQSEVRASEVSQPSAVESFSPLDTWSGKNMRTMMVLSDLENKFIDNIEA